MNTMNGDFNFFTVIGCMDGRQTRPIEEFIKNKIVSSGESREVVIDQILGPGIDAILAGESDFASPEMYKKMAQISANHHGSQVAIVVGHSCCAGNLANDEGHKKHICASLETVRSWGLFKKIIGVFVDEQRRVEVVSEYSQATEGESHTDPAVPVSVPDSDSDSDSDFVSDPATA